MSGKPVLLSLIVERGQFRHSHIAGDQRIDRVVSAGLYIDLEPRELYSDLRNLTYHAHEFAVAFARDDAACTAESELELPKVGNWSLLIHRLQAGTQACSNCFNLRASLFFGSLSGESVRHGT